MCSAQLPALQQTQMLDFAFVDYLRVLTIFFSTLGVNRFNAGLRTGSFIKCFFSQSADRYGDRL
jgi:hypothetical protein